MAKKSDPDPIAPDEAAPDLSPEVEIPEEVQQAFGGIPIPPPQFPRPTVSRVGSPLATKWRDKGGILAAHQPERRVAVAKIDKARSEMLKLVGAVENHLPKLRAVIAAAGESAEICEQEGFDPAAAERLLTALEGVLKKHLS